MSISVWDKQTQKPARLRVNPCWTTPRQSSLPTPNPACLYEDLHAYDSLHADDEEELHAFKHLQRRECMLKGKLQKRKFFKPKNFETATVFSWDEGSICISTRQRGVSSCLPTTVFWYRS